MATQVNIQRKSFQSRRINILDDNVRRNTNDWLTQQYGNRQQADFPAPAPIHYGKRLMSTPPQTAEIAMIDDDGDKILNRDGFRTPPVTLTWLNVQAEAPPKDRGIKRTMKKALCPWKEVGQPKKLLKGVSGIAKSGQLVAIMGASGAGKTTLLNVLTQRRSGNLKLTGEVRVNGTMLGRNISRISGYVQQEELFVPSMTTREHLIFHAMMRLDRGVSKMQRVSRVDELLDLLNLKKVENTVIGEPGLIKGLSGGEKRRLLFASEVITDPSLLFADEPTSGLDGSMAFLICDTMRQLCNQGKTIVCTIHQPSSEVFQLFDTLYMLAEGRTAYFGSRQKAETFFSGQGFKAPPNYNLSDFYIQILAIMPFDEDTCMERVERICDAYENSPLHAQHIGEAQKYHAIDDDQNNANAGFSSGAPKYKTGFFQQLTWLLWRSSIDTFRNPFELRLRLLVSVTLGIMFGLIFLRLQYNQQAFQNFGSVILVMILYISFLTVQKNADSTNRQLPLFFKEHDDAMYRTIPYYISRLIWELPISALFSFILGTIIYWMADLYNDVQRYFILQGLLILCAFVSASAGTLIGVSTPTPEAAAALIIPVFVPLLVFAGFFINVTTIRSWLIWIKYLSWLYYTNEMAAVNQWENVSSLECDNSRNITCFRNGTDVLNYYGFARSHYNRDLGLLFLLFVTFQVASLVVLILRVKIQRKAR